MQTASIWEFKGYTMRSSRIEDKDAYYLAGFTECDSEVARMTGSKMHYSKEEVDAYFVNCLNDSTRYDFAFCERKLHRLSLDVFSFNIRAKKAYEKAGFRVEGILRDAIWDNGVYADDILMSILEEEWKQIA